jgi:hypothetical protein
MLDELEEESKLQARGDVRCRHSLAKTLESEAPPPLLLSEREPAQAHSPASKVLRTQLGGLVTASKNCPMPQTGQV